MGNSPAAARTNVTLLLFVPQGLYSCSFAMTFSRFPLLAAFFPCSCPSFPRFVVSRSPPSLCFPHLLPELSCLPSVSVGAGEDGSCSQAAPAAATQPHSPNAAPQPQRSPTAPGRWGAAPAGGCLESGGVLLVGDTTVSSLGALSGSEKGRIGDRCCLSARSASALHADTTGGPVAKPKASGENVCPQQPPA